MPVAVDRALLMISLCLKLPLKMVPFDGCLVSRDRAFSWRNVKTFNVIKGENDRNRARLDCAPLSSQCRQKPVHKSDAFFLGQPFAAFDRVANDGDVTSCKWGEDDRMRGGD